MSLGTSSLGDNCPPQPRTTRTTAIAAPEPVGRAVIAPHDHVARRLTQLGDLKRLASLVEQHQRTGRVEADIKCYEIHFHVLYTYYTRCYATDG